MKKGILLSLILISGSLSQAGTSKMGTVIESNKAKNVELSKLRGSEGVGGGDEVGLEFQKVLQDVLEEVRVQMPALFEVLKNKNLQGLAANLKIVVADDELNVGYMAYIQDSAAANLPETLTILVNRKRWLAITDYKLKKAVALHELLSLAKLESTGSYSLSSKYLADQGLAEDYLDTVMMPQKKKSAGIAPRGVPRYEKSFEQQKFEVMKKAEVKIALICEAYFKKVDSTELVTVIGKAIEAVATYCSMLDKGQPDRLQGDAAFDELYYLQRQLIKNHFGTPNHAEESMKAFCRK